MNNHVNSPSWPENVGILAIELYVPYQYVDQTELEQFDGVSPGKYTLGLGQARMGYCTDREDINSLCLTVVQNLLEKNNISPDRVGRIEVGTETILDKSKSVKTVIMQLFEESGNTDIEGVDSINACYGGTAAILNSVAWIESSSWDGRLALVVCGDIAIYASGAARPTGGAGAVAILIGPNAPIVFERGLRASHASHAYDFYKPDLASEYPRVDGKLSIKCYLNALDKCYHRLAKKAETKSGEKITIESFDGVVFHSPYCKLVQKSLGRLLLNDVIRMKEEEIKEKYPSLVPFRNTKLEDSYFDRDIEKLLLGASEELYVSKTQPSLFAANQVGNMYTASVYGGLVSYLVSKPQNELLGNRVCVFSYGSGLQSSMYLLRIRSDAGASLSDLVSRISDVKKQLDRRMKRDPETFAKTLLLRESVHHKAPYEPVGSLEDFFPGTYYLVKVDEMHRREYSRVAVTKNGIHSA